MLKLPLIFSLAIISLFHTGQAMAQKSADSRDEKHVSIERIWQVKPFECIRDTRVYNDESLKKLLAFPDCAKLIKPGEVDFNKQTLISYSVGGDCHLMVQTSLTRNDTDKLYTFTVLNHDGGCRAAGQQNGLFSIEKIPADYRVRFVEYFVDGYVETRRREAEDSGAVWSADGVRVGEIPLATPAPEKPAPVALETREVDLKGCIRTYRTPPVIDSDEAFQKAIRRDAEEEECKNTIEKIDFSKNTLLGIEINSGYCRYPLGLTYQAVRDDDKKQVTLKISYIDPKGSVCRAMSQYDLWVVIPKIPAGYEAKFDVKARE